MVRVVDPVCGMEFAPELAAAQSEWLDRKFYFCHPVCKSIFDRIPTRFVYGGRLRRSGGRRCSASDNASVSVQ